MKRLNNNGAATGLVLILVVTGFLFFVSLWFGLWAFTSREDFKNNVDKKVAAAVSVAQKQTASEKDNEFVEKEKQPLKSYQAPEAYGSLTFSYPKTWSSLIDESGGTGIPVNGYFYPNFIPGLGSAASLSVSYALRVQVSSTTYAAAVKAFDPQATSGQVKVIPFKPDKVAGVVGVRIDGTIVVGKQGAMVILPLRDKSIQVWTESNQFVPDFNGNILPSLTYSP